jgi:hypothetical protein
MQHGVVESANKAQRSKSCFDDALSYFRYGAQPIFALTFGREYFLAAARKEDFEQLGGQAPTDADGFFKLARKTATHEATCYLRAYRRKDVAPSISARLHGNPSSPVHRNDVERLFETCALDHVANSGHVLRQILEIPEEKTTSTPKEPPLPLAAVERAKTTITGLLAELRRVARRDRLADTYPAALRAALNIHAIHEGLA